MGAPVDIAGQVFGRLTAIEVVGSVPTKGRRWRCSCACGNETVMFARTLLSEKTRSCGCIIRDGIRTSHGEAKKHHTTAEYRAWRAMKSRCYRIADENFRHYGGRGIGVCERWRRDFAAFLADMGRKPSPIHTVDRINPNGHYEPSNCRWATPAEQATTKRRPLRTITANGITATIADWSAATGIPVTTLKSRIALGMSPERIVATADHRERQVATLTSAA